MICVTLLLAGAVSSPCSAEIIAEYLGPHSNNGLLVWNNTSKSEYVSHAQAFTVTGSPTVTEVQLYLSRWSGSTGSVCVNLYHDSTVYGRTTSYPEGELAQICHPASEIPSDPGWVSFKLIGGGTALSPSRFWIVCSVGEDSDARIDWWGKAWGPGNNYGTGDDVMTSKDKCVTWPVLQGIDPMFRIFGTRNPLNTTTTVTVDPSTVGTAGSVIVTVTVRDSAGNLVEGPGQVDMTTSAGSFSRSPIYLENGQQTTTWTATGNTGNPTITATFLAWSFSGKDYKADDGTTNVSVIAQQDFTKTAQTVPSPTNTRNTINISVSVTDTTNPARVVSGGKVTFSCSKGSFGTNPATVVNGAASTTWTAPNETGTFAIKASYPGWTSGPPVTVFGSSNDSDDVTVDYTNIVTNTTVSVSPDYPYVGGKAWVKVEVNDGAGKAVPSGTVQLSALTNGWCDSMTIALANGKGDTIYHAPAAIPGDVNITGTYQGDTGGGNRYMPSVGNAVAHVTQDTDSGGSGLTYMLEWVTDYAWWQLTLPDLKKTDDDARGFGNKLKNDFAWTGHDYGNDSAQQDDFAGDNNSYLDKHDFTYFSGHGSPDCIFFNNFNDDTELHPHNATAAWGNKDCEWVVFSACKVMRNDDQWASTLDGAHLELGYTTDMWDNADFGGVFANLLTKDSIDDEAHPITQAFFLAGDICLDDSHRQRVIGETSAMFNDYIWGQGFVNPDPVVDDYYTPMSNDVDVNNAPHADAGGPYNGTAGQKMQLDGSQSWDPDSGDSVTYVWDMDTSVNSDNGDWDHDGVDSADDDNNATGRRPEYTYAGSGFYNIRLMIHDNSWVFATDTTTANIAASGRSAASKLTASSSTEEEGIEIVDKFNPANLPPETQLPKFNVVGTNLSYDELARMANYFGVSGSAGIDSIGNWNMVQGNTELIVNAYSGGVMYIDKSQTYTFTHPPGPLPNHAACVGAAEMLMNNWGITRDGAVVSSFTDCSIGSNQKDGRAPDARIPFQRSVNYRRLFTVPQIPQPVQYPAVGPGGKLRMILDDSAYDSRGFTKVWRQVVLGNVLNLVGATQAVQDFHRLVEKAVYGVSLVPECTRIEIDNVSLGYYEDSFVTYQTAIYPVYVLDLTCEQRVSSFKTQVFVPAAWNPLEANITSPSNASEFSYGTAIAFQGSAAGGTGPYTYKWESDKDGLLGTGASISCSSLSVNERSVLPVHHIISLEVADASNQKATSYISVLIKPTAVGNAKKSADDAPVALLGQVVTASFPDSSCPGCFYFYVETPDRVSGIVVRSTVAPPENSVACVYGTMSTNGPYGPERVVEATKVEILGTANPIEPLFTVIEHLGGGDFGTPPLGQKGVEDSLGNKDTGLNNIGLLMRIAGTVDYVGAGAPLRFNMNDGNVLYRTYVMPQVSMSLPPLHSFCLVTGVSSIGQVPSGALWRAVIVRRASDIEVLY